MAYEYDIFISYRRDPEPRTWVKDIFLEKFRHYLKEESGKKNLKIFIDEKEIEGGTYWEDNIRIALARSRCLVPVLMTSYFQSEWCAREFATMYYRQEQLLPRPEGLIVPFVIYDGDFFPDPVKAIQYHDCRDYYFTQKGFMESQAYLDFQIKLKSWVKAVLRAMQNAPQWNADWLSAAWSDAPGWNRFLLNEDLSIPQPHNQ